MVKIPANKLAQIILHNAKILDIGHGGPCTFTCSLSGTFPPNTIGLFLLIKRVSGSAGVKVYIVSGSNYVDMDNVDHIPYVPIVNQELKYGQDTGGEDFDLWCIAYVVEGNIDK